KYYTRAEETRRFLFVFNVLVLLILSIFTVSPTRKILVGDTMKMKQINKKETNSNREAIFVESRGVFVS
ncbi:MAG: hypothetical protein QMC28_02805, partial [Flavobacteriales bacterium]